MSQNHSFVQFWRSELNAFYPSMTAVSGFSRGVRRMRSCLADVERAAVSLIKPPLITPTHLFCPAFSPLSRRDNEGRGSNQVTGHQPTRGKRQSEEGLHISPKPPCAGTERAITFLNIISHKQTRINNQTHSPARSHPPPELNLFRSKYFSFFIFSHSDWIC